MKFIRAFWGDLNGFYGRHRREIVAASPYSATHDYRLNELVYVWGEENLDAIQALGFETRYMGEFNYDYVDDSHLFMYPKLWAIRDAVKNFGEVVFLDWDCYMVTPPDDTFWSLLRQRYDIQMPLYTYPQNYVQQVRSWWTNIPAKEDQYIEKQFATLQKFHYPWNGSLVTPNAGFIYCRHPEPIEAILDILTFTPEINIAIEEMAFTVFSKRVCKTVEEYITHFEPLVASAKLNDHFNQFALNSLLMPEKTLFFQHV